MTTIFVLLLLIALALNLSWYREKRARRQRVERIVRELDKIRGTHERN